MLCDVQLILLKFSYVINILKKKKFLIYGDKLFPPNMGIKGGGVLKLVRGRVWFMA